MQGKWHVTLLLVVLLAVAPIAVPGAGPARAAERLVRLHAPAALVDTGLFRYILPRFKLKTQIRVELLEGPDGLAGAEVVISDRPGAGGGARPLMQGAGRVYYAWAGPAAGPDAPHAAEAARLLDWLYSEIGQRSLQAFRRDDVQLFFAPEIAAAAAPAPLPTGDVQAGEAFSYRNCGRCHVVGPANRMQGIGSTPSFALLRSLPDWLERFSTYYARVPHPSFTQLEGVTEPFGPMLPPPIEPLMLTPEDLEAIIAYVTQIEPADLGAPLKTR